MFLHLNLSYLRLSSLTLISLLLYKRLNVLMMLFKLSLKDTLLMFLFSFIPHLIKVAIHHLEVVDLLIYQVYSVALLT